MNFSRALLLPVIAIMASTACAADTAATVQSFARATMLGIQLAIKQGRQTGKVSAATADCVAAFKPDRITAAFENLVKSRLSEDEQQSTESFFRSPTGIKYAKLNQLQVYQAMGQPVPEPLPEFSSAEIAQVESFSKTSAGEKLKALQAPAAMAPVNERIKELMAQCPRH